MTELTGAVALVALGAALGILFWALRKTAALREELAGLRPDAARAAGLDAALAEARQGAAALQAEKARLEAEKLALEGRIQALSESHEARLDEVRGLRKELEERFHALAAGVLDANTERFLALATERFSQHRQGAEAELAKREAAIGALVKPLGEKLGAFDARIAEIEQARNEAYGQIREQVKALAEGHDTLGRETRRLVQALRAPKTRGRWGEMQLRQVFEIAGMTEHVDYVTESTITTEEGLRRPDAVVRIPGGKSIVVDAKTPLEGYLDALEADGPEAQQHHIARHAAQVREHVKALASKAYFDSIASAPDFVVMFIPGETFVAAAAEVDPSLMEFAFERKVLIATPTTLMALIKAIAYGWQQEKMAENAAEVQRLAKELYDRLAIFAQHLERVGKSLGQSVEHYNKAVGSLEGRVLPSARRFEAMGVVRAEPGIAGPAGVEAEPRALTASEFVALPDDPEAGR